MKIPAKRKHNKGEDGGAHRQVGPPVHFVVCSRCGTVGAASIVNIHDARAIVRIVKRAQAEAARNAQSERSDVRLSRPTDQPEVHALTIDSLEEADDAQTTLF